VATLHPVYKTDVETLRLGWQLTFPTIPPPAEDDWLRRWLAYNGLSTVLAAFDHLSEGRYESTEHLSKMLTVTLKDVRYAE